MNRAWSVPPRCVIHEGWERWTDPATDLDELLDDLGIDPLPTPAEQAADLGISDEFAARFDPRCREVEPGSGG